MGMEHAAQTAHLVTAIVSLLLLAVGILALTRKMRLPFTVVLVLVGMMVSLLGQSFPTPFGFLLHLEISPELIFFIFLPTLIFESTFTLDSHLLRRELASVMALAVPGLLISTGIIGGIVWLVSDIPLAAALLLGAILSATDPVAVIALFKQLGAPKRLIVLVEGESLFNDATSIVLAKILLGVLAAGSMSEGILLNGIIDFILLFGGGLLVGCLLGLITGWLLGLVDSDSMIEITLTTVLAYLSFLIAEEYLHVSGVMAVVGAGLTMGGWGRVRISPSVQQYLDHFWKYLAFLANALIFLLVGMKVNLAELWNSIGLLSVVIGSMILARALLVYGLVPLVSLLPGAQPVDFRYRAMIFWGGLRGAIALALVLGLGESEYSELFTALVMGAVLFTLLVQGFSVGRLMHYTGLDKSPLVDRLAELEYELAACRKVSAGLDALLENNHLAADIGTGLQQHTARKIKKGEKKLTRLRASELNPEQEKLLLYLQAFAEEKAQFTDMFAKGHLSESAFRQFLLTLNMQIDAIRYQHGFAHIQTHGLRRRLEPFLYGMLDRLPLLFSLAERMRVNRISLDYENAWGHYQSGGQVLQMLDEVVRLDSAPEESVSEVRENYKRWRKQAEYYMDTLAEQFPEYVRAVQSRLGKRVVLLTRSAVAEELAGRGLLPEAVHEKIAHEPRSRLRRLRGQKAMRLNINPGELLRKVPFFTGMNAQEFDDIVACMRVRTCNRNETIITQGDTDDSLFLVARGILKVVRIQDGQMKEVARLRSGDIFGETALLHGEPRSATIKSVTPCSVYQLHRSDLDQIIGKYPDIGRLLAKADEERRKKRS